MGSLSFTTKYVSIHTACCGRQCWKWRRIRREQYQMLRAGTLWCMLLNEQKSSLKYVLLSRGVVTHLKWKISESKYFIVTNRHKLLFLSMMSLPQSPEHPYVHNLRKCTPRFLTLCDSKNKDFLKNIYIQSKLTEYTMILRSPWFWTTNTEDNTTSRNLIAF